MLPDDFDAKTYLDLHPDVSAAGVDAQEHYLFQGIKEGRAYKPVMLPDDFDAKTYLDLHPDVSAAGVDAQEHYLFQGIKEGRAYKPVMLPDDFDAKTYRDLHPDVSAAGIDAQEHYLSQGIKERRAYKPVMLPDDFDAKTYRDLHPDVSAAGIDAQEHYLSQGIKERRAYKRNTTSNFTPALTADGKVRVSALLSSRFRLAAPLRVFSISTPSLSRRLNLITDSISRASFFGGVGTSLIFCVLMANSIGASLRIVTRTERPERKDFKSLLSTYKLNVDREVEFDFAPIDDESYGLDIHAKDLFVTTSWWSTESTLRSVPPHSIFYLLQEDERMFYPFGDDRYRCDAVMRNKEIQFLINTELLFDHLVSNGLENIKSRGFWFEPAFPNFVYKRQTRTNKDERKKLFFYARPNNARNLFYLGIEVLDKAIQSGALDLENWDICLVGNGIPEIEFTSGYHPIKYEGLNWTDYAALIGTVDLGFSLMYTPHPSYPPLDLLASGAVVVTNKFLNKKDLKKYSSNVICADLDLNSLVDAISTGIELSKNVNTSGLVDNPSLLIQDWRMSFESIIEYVSENL